MLHSIITLLKYDVKWKATLATLCLLVNIFSLSEIVAQDTDDLYFGISTFSMQIMPDDPVSSTDYSYLFAYGKKGLRDCGFGFYSRILPCSLPAEKPGYYYPAAYESSCYELIRHSTGDLQFRSQFGNVFVMERLEKFNFARKNINILDSSRHYALQVQARGDTCQIIRYEKEMFAGKKKDGYCNSQYPLPIDVGYEMYYWQAETYGTEVFLRSKIDELYQVIDTTAEGILVRPLNPGGPDRELKYMTNDVDSLATQQLHKDLTGVWDFRTDRPIFKVNYEGESDNFIIDWKEGRGTLIQPNSEVTDQIDILYYPLTKLITIEGQDWHTMHCILLEQSPNRIVLREFGGLDNFTITLTKR